MTLRFRTLAAIMMAASTVLTGCQLFSSRQPAIQRWSGPVGDLRAQWSAEPGIDLLNGPAVPLRAYIESRWLAQWAGSLDYAYPGFTDAVPPNDEGTSTIGAGQRRPSVETHLTSPLIGNEQFHILSVNGSGRDVLATICNYTYSVSKRNDDGTYFSVASKAVREPRGTYAEQVSLIAPAEQAQPPLPPQEGPATSPDADVFGGWKVTGNLSSISTDRPGFANAWPKYDADTQSCVDQAPDPPARIAFLINGNHPRDEFPTSPASPGWPEKE
jgi:hypothetical protein